MNALTIIALTLVFAVPTTILITHEVTLRNFMAAPTRFIDKLRAIAQSRGWK